MFHFRVGTHRNFAFLYLLGSCIPVRMTYCIPIRKRSCIPTFWNIAFLVLDVAESCIPLLTRILHPHPLGILHSDRHGILHPDIVELCVPVHLWNLALQFWLGSCIHVRAGGCNPRLKGSCIPTSWNMSFLVRTRWNIAFLVHDAVKSCVPMLTWILHPHSLEILHSDRHGILHPDIVECCIPVHLWNVAFHHSLGSCIPVNIESPIPIFQIYCTPHPLEPRIPTWHGTGMVVGIGKKNKLVAAIRCVRLLVSKRCDHTTSYVFDCC